MCGGVMKRINLNESKTSTHARLTLLGAIVDNEIYYRYKKRLQLLKIVTKIVYTVSEPHYLTAWHLPLAFITSTNLCGMKNV